MNFFSFYVVWKNCDAEKRKNIFFHHHLCLFSQMCEKIKSEQMIVVTQSFHIRNSRSFFSLFGARKVISVEKIFMHSSFPLRLTNSVGNTLSIFVQLQRNCDIVLLLILLFMNPFY